MPPPPPQIGGEVGAQPHPPSVRIQPPGMAAQALYPTIGAAIAPPLPIPVLATLPPQPIA